MRPSSKAAVARIDIFDDDGHRIDWGTGFLAGFQLMLTAYHVIAHRADTQWRPKCVRASATFVRAGAVVVELDLEPVDMDRSLDFVVLRIVTSVPPEIDSIVLSGLDPPDRVPFTSWGYPALNSTGGFDISGHIVDSRALLSEFIPALQLFALQAAAPDAILTGLSGAPCIVNDFAVGVIRSFPTTDNHRVAAGTLYASPIAAIVSRDALRSKLSMDPCAALPPLPPEYPWPSSPYFDLRPYSANDARVFFGRCREIVRLLEMCSDATTGLILVCGQTGVGKSSLLRAGLFPRAAGTWSVHYATRNRDTGLASSFRGLLSEPSGLAPRLIVLDQVEEAFTRPSAGTRDELNEFAGLIAERCRACSIDRVIVAFRKEWLAELENLFSAHSIPFSLVLLEALSAEAVAEVVQGVPMNSQLRSRWDLTIEDAACSEIVSKVTADKESPVAPTLQVLLTRLWMRAVAVSRAKPVITAELVTSEIRRGLGLDAVLDTRLAALYKELPLAADGLALDILEFHTTELSTAEARTRAEMQSRYASWAETERVLHLLEEYGLIVDPRHGEPGVTRLAHDALAPLVKLRFNSSRLLGQRARRILENYFSTRSDAEEVLTKTDLDVVGKGQRSMRRLTASEHDLICDSRRLLVAQRRRRNLVAACVGVLLLGVAAAALPFGIGARAVERVDLPGMVIAASDAGRVAIVADSDNREKRMFIVRLEGTKTIVTPIDGLFTEALISPAGDHLLLLRSDGTLCWSSVATAIVEPLLSSASSDRRLEYRAGFSEDGKWAFAALTDGSVYAWRSESRPMKVTDLRQRRELEGRSARYVHPSMQDKLPPVQPTRLGITPSSHWMWILDGDDGSRRLYVIRLSDGFTSLGDPVADDVDRFTSVVHSANGQWLAFARHEEGTASSIDLLADSQRPVRVIDQMNGVSSIYRIAFSPDSRWLIARREAGNFYQASMSAWGAAIVTAASTNAPQRGGGDILNEIWFSPDSTLVTGTDRDGRRYVWRLDGAKPEIPVLLMENEEREGLAPDRSSSIGVAFCKGDDQILVGTRDGSVRLKRMSDGGRGSELGRLVPGRMQFAVARSGPVVAYNDVQAAEVSCLGYYRLVAEAPTSIFAVRTDTAGRLTLVCQRTIVRVEKAFYLWGLPIWPIKWPDVAYMRAE
jgi:hypothetical protein